MGKSSILRNIERRSEELLPGNQVRTFPEKIEEWQNYKGKTDLLKKMYENLGQKNDPWLVRLQVKIITDIMRQDREIRDLLPGVVCIQERDLKSCSEVFMEVNREAFHSVDFDLISDLAYLGNELHYRQKVGIYVTADTKTCYNRFCMRARNSEDSMDYKTFSRIYDADQEMKKHSHYIVDSTNMTPKQVAERVAKIIRNEIEPKSEKKQKQKMDPFWPVYTDHYNTLVIESLDPTVPIPTRATQGSAGYDFFAPRDIVVYSNGGTKIPSRIKIRFPPKTYMKLYPRSSHAAKGLSVEGGVVDNDYTGEISFVFQSTKWDTLTIKKGERMGQGVLMPLITLPVEEGDLSDFSPTTRGDGGFGSTGK